MKLTSINPFRFSVKKSKWFSYVKFGFHFPKKRDFRYWWQRRTKGWDDSELWNLNITIATFVLPRLKRYRKMSFGYPSYMTEKEWNIIVNTMIFAMEQSLHIDNDLKKDEETLGEFRNRLCKHQEGLKLFGKHFGSLWQ